MAYTTSLKVRFGDVDHAGIAYYPTIIDYLHRGFEDFWEGWMQTPYREVVDDHKGRIEIDSEMGKGTTIRILLPAA